MTLLLHIIWIALQILIGYNLVLPFILYVFYILFASKKTEIVNDTSEPDYAVIVTAYEQTHTLPAVVSSLLKMDYSNYLIYVVADKCDISNLEFNSDKVVLLRPEQTLASNTRSHFYAINNFKRQHKYLTIIDSDNLAEPDYLKKLNVYFKKGFFAVQGIRNAKNLDTTYACLDAARDIYYHFYDGKILFKLGSSATLAGSGMAFTVQLYKDCLEHLDVTGAGFDKVLQAAILQKNYRIAFTEEAIVYDEKTSRSDQLVKQRARWINTWFKYVKLGVGIFFSGIKNASLNQFLFGLILLRPPLFIFLLLSIGCMLINIFIQPLAVLIWVTGFLFFVISFFIALMNSNTDKRIYKSLINIPKFIFFQVLSLLKVRKANKYSVATQHYHDKSLDEVNPN
jgi:cellulose synthase/poly-beta-1,6-N-acetylglucosamine synthase-like glycosyltransferase